MWKDLKKTINAIKFVQLRSTLAPHPLYHDGFERLNERLHPTHQMLRIVQKTQMTRDITLLRGVSANPEKPLAPFRAGQYIGVRVIINGVQTGRAYSLVSSPNNLAYYEIAVKDLGNKGFVSRYLCQDLKIGDIIEITAPNGQFYYNQLFHGNHLLFIAGGCGVTPFLSLLRDFYERDCNLEIQLIYGCLTEKDILFHDELTLMAKNNPNFRYFVVLSEPDGSWKGLKGFITKDIIKKVAGSLENTMVYIVGPEQMRAFLLKEMADFQLRSNQVIWEVNPPINDITKMLGWPKDISIKNQFTCKIRFSTLGTNKQITIPVNATEPLLNSIERAKLLPNGVENACRAGECALCRSHLISGKVFVPPEVHIREADRMYGFIHPCVSYPISDCELEIYPNTTYYKQRT